MPKESNRLVSCVDKSKNCCILLLPFTNVFFETLKCAGTGVWTYVLIRSIVQLRSAPLGFSLVSAGGLVGAVNAILVIPRRGKVEKTYQNIYAAVKAGVARAGTSSAIVGYFQGTINDILGDPNPQNFVVSVTGVVAFMLLMPVTIYFTYKEARLKHLHNVRDIMALGDQYVSPNFKKAIKIFTNLGNFLQGAALPFFIVDLASSFGYSLNKKPIYASLLSIVLQLVGTLFYTFFNFAQNKYSDEQGNAPTALQWSVLFINGLYAGANMVYIIVQVALDAYTYGKGSAHIPNDFLNMVFLIAGFVAVLTFLITCCSNYFLDTEDQDKKEMTALIVNSGTGVWRESSYNVSKNNDENDEDKIINHTQPATCFSCC